MTSARGAREVNVGVQQADELRRDERDERHAVLGEGLGDSVRVEAVVEHGCRFRRSPSA